MNGISYRLEEKVVVVTGGSRGIGLELARNFLAQDARVVIAEERKRISNPLWKSSTAVTGSSPLPPTSPKKRSRESR